VSEKLNLNEILGDEFDVSAWAADSSTVWFSMSGVWGAEPAAMLDNQRLNPMNGVARRYFHPDAVIKLGPALLNPEEEVFRLFLTEHGEWQGPFTSFAKAAAAYAAFQQETSDED